MTTKAELAAAVVAAAQEVGSYPLGCIAKRVGSDGPDGLGWPATAHRVRDLNDALVRYENAPDDAPPDAAATKRVTVCEQADGFASLDTGEGQDMYGGVEPALRAAARHFGVSLDGPATNELAALEALADAVGDWDDAACHLGLVARLLEGAMGPESSKHMLGIEAAYARLAAVRAGAAVEVWKVCRLVDGEVTGGWTNNETYTPDDPVTLCCAFKTLDAAHEAADFPGFASQYATSSVKWGPMIFRATCASAEPAAKGYSRYNDGQSLSCRELRIVERVACYRDGAELAREAWPALPWEKAEPAPARPHEWKAGDLARIKPCSIWHQKEFVGRVIRLADTPDNNAPTGAHFHFTDGDDTGRKYYILTRELEPLPADVCQACGGALGDDAWQGECWDCVVKWADEQAKKVIAAVERERAAGHTVEVHMCEEPAPINCYDGRRLSLDAFAPCHVAGRWARFKQVHHVGNVGIQCDFGPCCGYHAGNVDAVRRVIAAVPAQPERREEVEL